jgi:hypothetical protein
MYELKSDQQRREMPSSVGSVLIRGAADAVELMPTGPGVGSRLFMLFSKLFPPIASGQTGMHQAASYRKGKRPPPTP